MANSSLKKNEPICNRKFQVTNCIPKGFEVTINIRYLCNFADYSKRWIFGTFLKSSSNGPSIYYAASKEEPDDYKFIIKLGGINDGIYVEAEYLCDISDETNVQNWLKKKNLPYLGLPNYFGYGEFTYMQIQYGFIVLDKLDTDLCELSKKIMLSEEDYYIITLSLIDTLEYIHSQKVVHWDVKASNILIHKYGKTRHSINLVDFDCSKRFILGSEDIGEYFSRGGTPLFSSRDVHRGLICRRADIENLCFNLIYWISGRLPWDKKFDSKDFMKLIQEEKERCMEDVDSFLNSVFKERPCPDAIKELLIYVSKLEFKNEPDYDFCRGIFEKELKKLGRKKTRFLTLSKNGEFMHLSCWTFLQAVVAELRISCLATSAEVNKSCI